MKPQPTWNERIEKAEPLWIAEWGVHAFQFATRKEAEAWLNEGCLCGLNHGGVVYDLNDIPAARRIYEEIQKA